MLKNNNIKELRNSSAYCEIVKLLSKRMIQFEAISVFLDTQRNITGFTTSEALYIIFPISEKVLATLTFFSKLDNVIWFF